MKVDANFSGLDEFLAEAEDEIKQGMIEVAHEGVDFAKTHGEYKNHTHNLRSAPGAAVVMDGEIVDMYIPHPKADIRKPRRKRRIFCFTVNAQKTE